MEETHIQCVSSEETHIGQRKSYQPEIYFHLNFHLCQQTLCINIASQSEILKGAQTLAL